VVADGVQEAFGVLRALAVYRTAVLPRVARELRRWEAAAAAIPDPVPRGHALAALREKSGNVEATAVFATLAPRRTRPAAVVAMTRLQVAVDYLDTLGEQPSREPLASGLALHGALAAALDPEQPPEDWHRHSPWDGDGGYLGALVGECREAMAALPAADAVRPFAVRAATRCGAGQSRTHAAELTGGNEDLEAWARSLEAPEGYEWWELAAGACSSVAAHALIAAAADPETGAAEAELIDRAYFPPVGALTVILDDLVDRDADLAAGAHNYTAYYAGPEEMARRLVRIAAQARAATAPLPRRPGHRAILDGVLGYYLSHPEARTSFARPTREQLRRAAGTRPALIAAVAEQRRDGPGDIGSAPGPSTSNGPKRSGQ
jgi:Protein of unknown function (DUF2600)